MLLGACIGWAISPATRYRTTALFEAEPMPFEGHWSEQAEQLLVHRRRELQTAAFTTLRSPDLPDTAVQQRGPYPASVIQTGAQLRNHLDISSFRGTSLIQVSVEDVSRSGADRTLEAYVASANTRIRLAGPPELIELSRVTRLRTSDHRESIFAASGAAFGAIVTIRVLLFNRRRSRSTDPTLLPPLQPTISS
jgi:hypothetical protein